MTPIVFLIHLTISFYEGISNAEDLYQEVEQLNVSCFPFDSCRSLPENSSFDHLWGNRTCECGEHCVRHRTCCADSKHVTDNLPVSFPLPEHEQCEKLKYFPTPIMVVSRCNSDPQWAHSTIKKCEESDYSSNDRLLMNMPMTNLITNTTYKNAFCAECNYETRNRKETVLWNAVLTAAGSKQLMKYVENYGFESVAKSIKYDPLSREWKFFDRVKRENVKVEVRYNLPISLRQRVKPCYVNIKDTCKSTRTRGNGCKKYYSPVEVETEERTSVYQNIHCMICNNVNISSVKINSCMSETLRDM